MAFLALEIWRHVHWAGMSWHVQDQKGSSSSSSYRSSSSSWTARKHGKWSGMLSFRIDKFSQWCLPVVLSPRIYLTYLMIEPQERKTENFQTQLSMNKHYAFRQASSCQENESKGFCQKKMGALPYPKSRGESSYSPLNSIKMHFFLALLSLHRSLSRFLYAFLVVFCDCSIASPCARINIPEHSKKLAVISTS